MPLSQQEMPKWLQDAETQVAQTPNMLNSIMTQTDKLQMIDGATQYAAAVANDAGSQTEQKRYNVISIHLNPYNVVDVTLPDTF